MLRGLKKLLHRSKSNNLFSFSELKKGKVVIALELVNDKMVARVGYLESLKDGIMTAYYPSLQVTRTARYINNNWVLIGED